VALVHLRLLDGVAELAQRSVDVVELSDPAAALQATRLLLPLVAAPVDGRHLPYRWAEVIAAIGCLDLVDPLIDAHRAYRSSGDQFGALMSLAHALTQPDRQASLRLLLGYIQALADSGEAQAGSALREAIARRTAATEPAARQLWLLALAATVGGAMGATGSRQNDCSGESAGRLSGQSARSRDPASRRQFAIRQPGHSRDASGMARRNPGS